MPAHDAVPDEPLTAVILAGGAGRRMGGTDKSAIRWRGQALIRHVVDALAPQVDRIVINAPSTAGHFPIGIPVIPDSWADRRGPLAGLLAGLEHSTTPLTLIVPCDSPFLPSDLARRLGAAFEQVCCAAAAPTDLAYASHGDDHHYLYALARTSLAPGLRRYLEGGGRAVQRWYQTISATAVEFPDGARFVNLNTPDDIAHLNSLANTGEFMQSR